MTFPVDLNLFGLHPHPHAVFELLAYTFGFQLYLFLRRRWRRAEVPLEKNLWLIVGCVFGALVGAKLLAWLESPLEYWRNREQLAALLGGKTIVGGLLGGWAGVEIAKRRLRITHSTGDVYVFPLIVGMGLGRVGCFLTGLPDHTYGVHTGLPWGVDFGDGPRHPTQLYEIAFLLVLGTFIALRMTRPYENGMLFRLFMLGYLAFRFAVEFIKPVYNPYLGLSMIQLACIAGIACCASSLAQRRAEVEGRAQEAAGSTA
ncbi:MAG TPA: prolipoprotein diacylglyceryl transferase family protein [Tepidisphaeraceae bacterium]|nr:prolipoprotein diacylglyceryl transferase family protein [Tepidisphaeraceae bacterium]